MKKEGEIMARVLNRVNDVNIPSYVKREIGINDNWRENVSPKQRRLVFKITNKFKEALRKLSKN